MGIAAYGIFCVERTQETHTLGGKVQCFNFGLNPSQRRQSFACPMHFKTPNLEVEYLRAHRK